MKKITENEKNNDINSEPILKDDCKTGAKENLSLEDAENVSGGRLKEKMNKDQIVI